MKTDAGTTLLPAVPDPVREGVEIATRGKLWLLSPLVAAIAIFVVLATALALTKAPWCDEGWFANPAYNLAFHGQMGTNVLEPSGHFLKTYLNGIQERTYIMVPNHIVALAGWFRIFGFSLLTMREYSIVWGAIGLAVLFYILYRLFPDRRVAQFGTLFTAIDFIYLWTSADGRMDCSSNVLALASLAAFLCFRDRNFGKAVFISQVLGAAAVFTHPNALVVLLTVPVLVWRFDRSQVRLRHLFLAAAPYVFFGVLWSLYIVQSPSDFAVQFFANAAGPNSLRWKTIVQPWRALWLEILRHLAIYGANGLWSGVTSAWMLFIPVLYIAALTRFIWNRRTYTASVRAFLICTVTVMLGMTFLNGFKAFNYFVYLVPFYNTVTAVWLLHLWRSGLAARATAVAVGIAFATVQIAASVQHVKADEYHRDYVNAIAQLKEERAAGETIVGTAALGFGLGFHGFTDDWRLGQYSHFEPDVVVIDRSYRTFATWFQNDEPLVFSHIVSKLTTDYRLSSRFGTFWIFERVKRRPGDSPVPWIDIGDIRLKKTGERAQYLFEQLSANTVDISHRSTPDVAVRLALPIPERRSTQ